MSELKTWANGRKRGIATETFRKGVAGSKAHQIHQIALLQFLSFPSKIPCISYFKATIKTSRLFICSTVGCNEENRSQSYFQNGDPVPGSELCYLSSTAVWCVTRALWCNLFLLPTPEIYGTIRVCNLQCSVSSSNPAILINQFFVWFVTSRNLGSFSFSGQTLPGACSISTAASEANLQVYYPVN